MANRALTKQTGKVGLKFGEKPKGERPSTLKDLTTVNMKYDTEKKFLEGTLHFYKIKCEKSLDEIRKIINDFLDGFDVPGDKK